MTAPAGASTGSPDYEPPAVVVLGTIAELTALGTGLGAEALAQGSTA